MATRRLMKERASLEKQPLEYALLDPLEGENIHSWKVRVIGPSGTPYSGGKFTVHVEFPAQYPFKPPSLKFLTKVYHPSVQQDTGEICTDLVGDGWGPTLNVRHCLGVIYQMLQEPTADHPLDDEIAAQLQTKPKEFEKAAKKFTKEYAK